MFLLIFVKLYNFFWKGGGGAMGVQMSNFIGVLKGYCNISVVFNGFPLCSSLRIIYFLKTTRFGTLSMTRYIRTWHTLSPTTGLPPHTIRKFHVTACTLYWAIRLLITDKFSMVLVHESSENVSLVDTYFNWKFWVGDCSFIQNYVLAMF